MESGTTSSTGSGDLRKSETVTGVVSDILVARRDVLVRQNRQTDFDRKYSIKASPTQV
jgi:hypothetical protein